VVHTIEGLGIWHPVIKWPNDVLLEGKKVSGILIDSELERDRVLFAIAGIGLNVNFDPSSLPEIADIATSLSQKAGRELSRWELLPSLFQHFELLYQALRRGESLQQRWQSRLETLGKHIRVKVGERVEEGWAEATHEDGSLLLRRPDGTLTTLVSGEVTFHL
jgi:BirA family biotin operon repressor/biotin-[acetyl-CoA-carboxylase] ligase